LFPLDTDSLTTPRQNIHWRANLKDIEIEARGMTFQALADGPEDGPLLLLLHGLPRNRWEWHHQIPPMAAMGFRVVAPDLRGFCPGARPEGVEAYHMKEYAQDVLEIADALGHAGRPFHLMGTSIGATMAWWLAAKHPDRVATLVCINIPHPGALAAGRSKTGTSAEGKKAKFNYIRESAREDNERNMFEAMLATQGVSPEESEPYRKALDSDEALRAVYNYYRAIPLWMRERLDPVPMPTMFIWPTGSVNARERLDRGQRELGEGPLPVGDRRGCPSASPAGGARADDPATARASLRARTVTRMRRRTSIRGVRALCIVFQMLTP
jgi:pimeloyl-ACP methyl ester carboxylesterase